jgi:hypothetical protein
MTIYSKFNQTAFRCLFTSLILIPLCSCSNPEEKILGKWDTSSDCTSKKGVHVSYVGSSRALKDGIIKDKGKMKIKSTDAQGRIIEAEIESQSEGTWSITNNKISQKNISNEFSVWSVMVNSNSVYSSFSQNNNPQAQVLVDGLVADLKKSAKEHGNSEFEIIQLDDKKLIVKNKSIEHSNNFDPGVCETQEFTRGVYLGPELEGPGA